MKLGYRSTILACYNGYITQAICINLAPLLYLTFQTQFSLSVTDISTLIAVNFLTQLLVDILASRFAAHMNLRLFTVLAHLFSAAGLVGLSLFPVVFHPFAGLLLAVGCLGVGGGFTEVTISPLLEACPTDEKSGNMSLLHSFYCWGQASVVLLSSVYFFFFDIEESWQYLPYLWAIVPLVGAIAFSIVPIYRLPADAKGENQLGKLFRNPTFFCFLIMMICAGAGEMIMSQWSSAFFESALGLPKELGDLLGPCMFALMMGTARALYAKFSDRIDQRSVMLIGCVAVAAAYLLAAFAPFPALSLVGCGLCGLGIGIFWPGTLSRASAAIPTGGMSMFAILALGGDVGCLIGPAVAGGLADAFGGDLRLAFCFALIFPAACFLVLFFQKHKKGEDTK